MLILSCFEERLAVDSCQFLSCSKASEDASTTWQRDTEADDEDGAPDPPE